MKEDNEIWKDVKGFEERYEISNKGRVRSKEREIEVTHWNRWKDITRKTIVPEKIIKDRDNGSGYRNVNLNRGDKQHTKYIHRLMAEAFIPNPDGKKYINHKNGIKDDNRLDNLEWCTAKENSKHALERGLMKTGEEHHTSKLTHEEVREILGHIKNPEMNYREIADQYDICKQTITNIKQGNTYKSVTRQQHSIN